MLTTSWPPSNGKKMPFLRCNTGANNCLRLTILQLNIEDLTANKIRMVEQLASKYRATTLHHHQSIFNLV